MEPDAEPRPLTGGAVMTAASRVAVAVSGALTTIVIARLLGPSGSGGFATAQTLVLLLIVATTLGVEHGISYMVSSSVWPPRAAFASSLRLAAGVGLAGGAIAVGIRAALPSAFADLTVAETAVTAIAVPFWLAFTFTGYVALATDRYEAFVLPPATQSILACVLAVPGAALFDLPGAIVGMTLATVATGAVTAWWGNRRFPRTDTPPPPGVLRRAMSFGARGYMANALQAINYRLDIFILSAVASTAQVGQYAVAIGITTVLWLLPNALSDVLFPRIARLTAEDAEAHREMVELKGLRHTVMIVIAISAVVALALLLLVVPVYGEAFRPAIDVGLLLLPGSAVLGISNVLGSSLIGRGFPQYGLYTVAIIVGPTIALYATLIPAWDARGAALASTLSYIFTTLITAFFYRRVTGRNVFCVMVPTRSEWDDLRRLPAAARAWARGLRA
ncbi:MAG: hypothetical protein QOF76_4899 [Solirubrobacteraceae bacterium]|nr:hypothetical protein [Solirubrobacteraceae bacterium]